MREFSGTFSGEFSGLYREMCGEAKWLQKEWVPRKNDYYCERGDYEDGPAEFLYPEEVPKGEEEIKNFKSKYVWLPRGFHIIERVLGEGIPKLINSTVSRYYEFLKDEEKLKDIEDRFKDKVDDIMNVNALVFCGYEFGRFWDFEQQDWIEIHR